MSTLIYERIVKYAESEVTFRPIPQEYRHLRIVGKGRSTWLGGSGAGIDDHVTPVRLRFNGDAEALYQWQATRACGRTGIEAAPLTTAGGGGDEPAAGIAYFPGGSLADPGNQIRGSFNVFLIDYRDTGDPRPSWNATGGAGWGVVPGTFIQTSAYGFWRRPSQEPIERIKLILDAGLFYPGSKFWLYGDE